MEVVKKYIGTKEFYKKVIVIAIPLLLQQLLVNTFSIVDTLMVGSIHRGIAGVGIASQISSIIMIVNFGINTGASMFLSQFYGAKDEKNMKNTLGLCQLLIIAVVGGLSILAFIFPDFIIQIFNRDPEVVVQARAYLRVVVWAFPLNALSFSYTSALRSLQKTKPSLYINVFSSIVNVFFNYLLIFGVGPFPKLGVTGAAIATIISGVVSLVFHFVYCHHNAFPFMPKLENYRLALKKRFFMKFLDKTTPLIVNELFFSVGTSLYIVFMNTLGSDAYEGYRIAESIANIMFSVSFGFGTATMVILGEVLGAKDFKKADIMANWFIGASVVLATIVLVLTYVTAPFLVSFFKVDIPAVMDNATRIMKVYSLRVAMRVFVVMLFSAFRAGGESKFVMILDAGILWTVGIPLAFLMTKVFNVTDVAIFYLILQLEQVVRIIVGMHRYNKRTWINNISDNI